MSATMLCSLGGTEYSPGGILVCAMETEYSPGGILVCAMETKNIAGRNQVVKMANDDETKPRARGKGKDANIYLFQKIQVNLLILTIYNSFIL